LPFTIPAGQSVSFNVAFTPKSTGAASGSFTFISDASVSKAVEQLTGSGIVQQHTVNLSWNASSDAVGYNVYRSTSANGSYAKVNSALDPITNYSDSSVFSGITYYYEATAVSSDGQESARSTPPVQTTIP
jgi:fibronectin type 3 domain-containing protein